jgi:hypothetical protein
MLATVQPPPFRELLLRLGARVHRQLQHSGARKAAGHTHVFHELNSIRISVSIAKSPEH